MATLQYDPDGLPSDHWYACTDDEGYDASGPDPAAAALALADALSAALKEEVEKKNPTPDPDRERFVVTGPRGFTEAFEGGDIDLLVDLGLIEHERDGHVLEDGRGNGVGALHHFYRKAP